MNLRTKTLITVIITFFSAIIFIGIINGYIIIKSHLQVERNSCIENTNRAISLINDRINFLRDKAADWAAWDDTYNFVEKPNSEYIRSNLNNFVFDELKMNLIYFLNKKNQIIYHQAFDYKNNLPLLISDNLKNFIFSNDSVTLAS